MNTTALILAAAVCGATAFAQDLSPDALARIRAEKERIQKIMQAAENLQAAGMEREANGLREQARRQAEELEAKARQGKEQAEREQAKREQAKREPGDRERREAAGERPNAEAAQLQAQIAELRATVRKLAERLERLEAIARGLHPDVPKPDAKRE